MRKYISKEEFFKLVYDLPETKHLELPIENTYDGNTFICKFAYADFNGGTFLYASGYPEVTVIQDTYIATFDEQLSDIWEDIVDEDINKPFLELKEA
jgi:hypothetical protein